MRSANMHRVAVMVVVAGLIGGCASAYGEGGVACEQIEKPNLTSDSTRTVEFVLDSTAARRATTLGITVASGEPGQMAVALSGTGSHSRLAGPVEGHRCEISGAGLAGEWQLRVETEAPVRVLVYDHAGRTIAESPEMRPGALPATLAWSGVR